MSVPKQSESQLFSPNYDSARRHSAMVEEFIQLVRYRHLLWLLIENNIKTRYRRSVLGVLWTLLNPLLTMTVMTIAFARLFHSALENYSIYILSGLLFWNFLAQSMTASINSMVWGSGLLKRVYVPRTIFAVATIGNSLVNLGLGMLPLLIIMVFLGHPITLALLFLPIAVVILAMFVLGVALFVSSLAVFFTDIVDIFQVMLTAWLYLTPVIYPNSILPEIYQRYLFLNPAYPILSLFRDPIYLGQIPDLNILLIAILTGCLSLLVGWWFFTRRADEIAYRI